jgi:hypothetical protein
MLQLFTETAIRLMKVSSNAFSDNQYIPSKYTCDGLNLNPDFTISDIPLLTKSLAIIVEDPDAPINTWVHWVVWNIPVTHHIKENTLLGTQGVNDFSRRFYCGPCPYSGTHHYLFKFYALDALLDLSINTRKLDLEKAMSDHILAFGQITGLYKRK